MDVAAPTEAVACSNGSSASSLMVGRCCYGDLFEVIWNNEGLWPGVEVIMHWGRKVSHLCWISRKPTL